MSNDTKDLSRRVEELEQELNRATHRLAVLERTPFAALAATPEKAAESFRKFCEVEVSNIYLHGVPGNPERPSGIVGAFYHPSGAVSFFAHGNWDVARVGCAIEHGLRALYDVAQRQHSAKEG